MSLDPLSFQQAEYVAAPADVMTEPDSTALVRAIAFGLAGAVAGALVYAAFIGITHIQIGYLSIGVAFLVAKAMMMGSKERGGIDYQVTTIVLTCVAVAAGNALLLLWHLHERAIVVPGTFHTFTRLAAYGFEEPFLEFQDSPGGAILGLFILFIGLRAAWRMTSGLPGASHHPFRRATH